MTRSAADAEQDRRQSSSRRRDDCDCARDRQARDRSHPAASLHRAVGNGAVQALHEGGGRPDRLRVGPADGAAERRAESAADATTRAPEPDELADRVASGDETEATEEAAGPDVGDAGTTAPDGPAVRRVPASTTGAVSTDDGEVELDPAPDDAETTAVPGAVADAVRATRRGGRRLSSDLRSRFGSRFDHDFDDVRVHTGSRADEAARAVGARAFAYGRDVAFRAGAYRPESSAGRRLLAHELAHVVQQSRGETRLQRYLPFGPKQQKNGYSMGWEHPNGDPIRVSDDGRMAVEDNGWGPGTNKLAWTTKKELSESNAKLEAAGSNTQLVTTSGTISGKPPNDRETEERELTRIKPEKASGSGKFTLKSDCGAACKQVMGSSGEKDVAAYQQGETEAYTEPKEYSGADNSPGGTTNTPEKFFEDVLRDAFGDQYSRKELYRKYDELSDEEKAAFDEKYGLNEHAKPEVGEGQTISTGYDTPGFSKHEGEDSDTWNFHYAATVLRSGPDHVTLESADDWGPGEWIFHMYGSRSMQSFHEEHSATLDHGTKHQTMVVKPAEQVRGETSTEGVHLVREPRNWKSTRIGRLDAGTKVRLLRQGDNWLKVEVLDGDFKGRTGWVSDDWFDQ